MNVLGLESSCDETAAAVVGPQGVVADVVYSQKIHAEYGGVVPELAARAHVEKVGTVARAALRQAGLEKPDAIAATAGPGLIGALLVGLSFGKAVAAGWDVPFYAVNHLEGHILSPLLEEATFDWPFLALVVSGGHTAIYLCRDVGDYQTLGHTVDDAAGEAYDKVARLLNLGYPGGPPIDRLAAQGNPEAVKFPRPNPKGLNFSFSGLKTSVRSHVMSDARASNANICASFQAAVIDCLIKRVQQAVKATNINRVAITGGVAANSGLRARALATPGLEVFLPTLAHCTDNAAMIANVGRMRLMIDGGQRLDVKARSTWELP
ncbi:MAG: tRNA (adenosine(37)-N6)-threonylcarbamoyltransferase complex transferase subunit TsaD [Proteobacteria bacterium]|nr:tRNA (adenosine(37)-N6)-threonylcarbamoyltransferase complex transferase subunit TsaD [Pseudomonadota bacterium]